MLKTLNIKTSSRTQMLNITPLVRKAVSETGIQDGICTLFVPHTTAGITINENADPDVVTDMLKEMNKVIPFEDGYRHMEGNSAAHIKASLFGFSQQVILSGGQPVLGIWQGIYFCEFDGPRERQLHIKIISG